MRDSETSHSQRGTRPRRRALAVGRLCLLAAPTALSLALFASPAAAVTPPVAMTSPPAATSGGYELKGRIYTYYSDTHYHFEYGTTTAYGTSVPVPDADAGTESVVSVAQTVTDLQPNTTYHFRIVASNAGGNGESPDRTFYTGESPSTTAPPASPYPTTGGSGGQGAGTSPTKGAKVKLKIVQIKGKRVLANSHGHTLYSLSVEKNGKFICTKSSGCLGIWRPLLIPEGGSVTGPVKLGSVKRPEGGRQATYRGRPLYTFRQDKKAGQTFGEGLKDVGTWHAVTVPGGKR